MPQHSNQTTCKSWRQYLYHDPTQFSSGKCKATFRSHLSLKQHWAQLCACQSSSEDEDQLHLQSAADITPLGAASDTTPFFQSQLDALSVEANTNPEDSAVLMGTWWILAEHTFRNILCILELSDSGQQSAIQRWLKSQAVCCIIAGWSTFPQWMDGLQHYLNTIVIYLYFSHTFSKILHAAQNFWDSWIWDSMQH